MCGCEGFAMIYMQTSQSNKRRYCKATQQQQQKQHITYLVSERCKSVSGRSSSILFFLVILLFQMFPESWCSWFVSYLVDSDFGLK